MIKKLRAVVEFVIHEDGHPSQHSLTMEAARECSIADMPLKLAELLDARLKLMGAQFTKPLEEKLEAAEQLRKVAQHEIAALKAKAEPKPEPLAIDEQAHQEKKSQKRSRL